MLSASGHSFTVLCVPFRHELVIFARRLTSNPDLAEDIVQDALMKALLAWGGWSPNAMVASQSARSWLYRIVSNLFANDARNSRLHRRAHVHYLPEIACALYGDVDSVGAIVPLQDPEQAMPGKLGFSSRSVLVSQRDPDPTFLDDMISSEVIVAVGRLHPKRREVVQRYYFQGETCETIGSALGITSGCVRSLLLRARAKLAPLLERFARLNYELGSAWVDPHAKPAKRSEPEPHRVQRIVRQVNRRPFRRIQMAPDQASAGGI